MAARTAKLHLTPGFLGSTVEVDGQKLTGIRALDLHTAVNELPTITLDLIIREVDVDGEAIVTVPDKTHAALVALGWTPPAEPAPGEPAEIATLPVEVGPRQCCPYGGHAVNDMCRHADGRPVLLSEAAEIRARYPLD
ncbi:hypothetical protein [Streptosporangium minutum]|uniref:Uncharacterized protein n=1 Tax=Streptosporangium minutum TaxID=569862 RepID=A0A243RVW4_9ACTN|nr:hypothetical protein [Streptosporangium minutum]OUC99330.1 hypothetical protein CA984_03735 [Streptosporangium minutum]